MTSREFEDLKRLLRRMRQEDAGFRVFGARQHHYVLGPSLTEPELLGFEHKHGIRLPEDYRHFLAKAGNGGVRPDSRVFMGNSGAGPFYGLIALDEAAQDCDLRQPFPFTESTEALPSGAVAALIDPERFPGVPGALPLCHAGCGIIFHLIVKGPAAGTIWQGSEDYENFYPAASSFDAWYGNWMRRLGEHALPRLASERKITGVRGGMTQAEVIALCGGEWEQKPLSVKKRLLSFRHLSTVFEMNENGVVVQIIPHKIYC